MGVMCKECESWFHIFCQGIGENTYKRLGNSNVVWTCLSYSGLNFSLVLFDLHGIDTNNKFNPLTDSSFSTSVETPDSLYHQGMSQPLYTSSHMKSRPKPASSGRPLRTINVNCQSLVNKKPLMNSLIESSKPDIIIATETWFTSQIHDAEYFDLDNFAIYRRDRGTDTAGGGVLIAVNKNC